MTVTLLGAILETALERELISRNPAAGGVAARVSGRQSAPTSTPPFRSKPCSTPRAHSTATRLPLADHRRAQSDDRHADLRGASYRRALCPALARRRPGRRLAACRRRQDGRWAAAREGSAARCATSCSPRCAGATRTPARLTTCSPRRAVAGRARTMCARACSASRRVSSTARRSRGRATGEQANKQLETDGLPPLPDKLTPHSLRRTFCSLLYALGEDPGLVMDEMGHTDPALALRVYRQAMRRGSRETAALSALLDGPRDPGHEGGQSQGKADRLPSDFPPTVEQVGLGQ